MRERVREFHQALCRAVFGWHEWDGEDDYDGGYPMFCVWDLDQYVMVYEADGNGNFDRHYCALEIDGAKAATDAILRRSRPNLRWQFWLRDDPDGYCCCLILKFPEGRWQQFEAIASTEELARSACALLAAQSLDSA